jgi:hypothetical protein
VRQRSLNVAKANYKLIKDKFNNEVAFISDAPKSMTDVVVLNCHIHGNVETNLNTLKNAKKACKYCSQGKQVIINNSKQCSICKAWKDVSQYKIEKGKRLKARCIDCERERVKQSIKKIDKQKLNEAQKRYKERHGLLPNYKTDIAICKCEYCSKVWTKKGRTLKRFCSIKCKQMYVGSKIAGRSLVRSVKQYNCKCCSEVIFRTAPGKCDSCFLINKKTSKAKHKAIRNRNSIKIERIVAWKVFSRDKFRCQLCNIKVQKIDYLLDNAAEVDHIVPISLGGVHSYSNVQTLCRKCNQTKSNKYHGQLVLAL